mgnify:CR=1 FL=1
MSGALRPPDQVQSRGLRPHSQALFFSTTSISESRRLAVPNVGCMEGLTLLAWNPFMVVWFWDGEGV